MLRIRALLGLALLAACTDAVPTTPTTGRPSFAIGDAASIGTSAGSRVSSASAQYQAIDLGGAPAGGGSQALALNDRGQVLIRSYTSRGRTVTFYLWENGKLTDLGTLGENAIQPLALNERGQVTGFSRQADGTRRVFLWERGVMTDLGATCTCLVENSVRLALNNHGQITWQAEGRRGPDPEGFFEAFFHTFLWQDGVVTDLGSLGSDFSFPVAINKRGDIAGWSLTTNGQSAFGHAFLWRNGVMTDLGTLGGSYSEPVAINDRGQVLGISSAASGFQRAVLWQDGTIIDLGFPEVQVIARDVNALNNRGQVLGHSWATGRQRPFLWQDGVITHLGTLGGDWIRAQGLNDAGQVVGNSNTADGTFHAFLWQDGVMTDLGTLGDLDEFGAPSSGAIAVNKKGQVAGSSRTAGGEIHATLWEPLSR